MFSTPGACSGDDGDASSRLVALGTYRSPQQDQGWLSKEGGNCPRASFNTKPPCITIFLGQFAYQEQIFKPSKHCLLAFGADTPKHDAAQRGIGIEPAGVSQPLVTSPTHTGTRCAAEPGIPLAEKKKHAASRASFSSASAMGNSSFMRENGILLVCAETAVAFRDNVVSC